MSALIKLIRASSINFLFFILMISLTSSVAFGQNWKKGLETLKDPVKSSKFENQAEKAFIDNSENIMANYWLSLYKRKNPTTENVFSSWMYINRAVAANSKPASFPVKSELQKILVTPDKKLENEFNSVDSVLWALLSKETQLDKINGKIEFLEKSKYFEFYRQIRNKLEAEAAIKLNSLEGYSRFLALYPNALEAADIIARRDVLELEKIREKGMVFAFNEFIAKHPKSATLNDAVRYRDEKSWYLIANTNDLAELDYFIANYPTSPLIEEAISARQELAFKNAMATNTIDGFQNFINHHALTKLIDQAIQLRDALVYSELQKYAECSSYNIFMSGLPFADRAFKAFLEQYSSKSNNRIISK